MKAYDLVAHADISYRQLDHWTRSGYIHERDPERAGSGTYRDYASTEVAVCVRIAALVSVGFTVPAAADLARRSVVA